MGHERNITTLRQLCLLPANQLGLFPTSGRVPGAAAVLEVISFTMGIHLWRRIALPATSRGRQLHSHRFKPVKRIHLITEEAYEASAHRFSERAH